ncbi:DEAD/DEAH box helicase [bacterium]|nr:DEAD/DEAH box helicase [candidate division CSSED10-310 bacterium]
MTTLEKLIGRLIDRSSWNPDRCIFRSIPAKPARFSDPEQPLPDVCVNVLKNKGIERLYTHQAHALDELRSGNNVLLATHTASGKSLSYQIPTVEMIQADPETTVMYLFPFKALAQDQAKSASDIERILPKSNRPFAGIYDGDTTPGRRRQLRQNPPSVLITNPDLLHYGFLPYHTRWKHFLEHLKLIVVDEIHVYRGVFGSHVLQVFRRLNRILDYYGAHPVWIACSATIGNPDELARKLTGHSFHVISDSGTPTREKGFLSHFPEDRAAASAVQMFESCLLEGMKTIVFTKSRQQTERVYRIMRQRSPALTGRIAIYRAGFLAHERREIERRLFQNELDGVVSTSALEHGIDIGGLDCCILIGFPGSVSSLWQRAGRVGRAMNPSLVVYIVGEDALDRYWYEHESLLHRTPVELVVVYENNDVITDSHLECTADELPIRADGVIRENSHVRNRIQTLLENNVLLETADGSMYVCRSTQPQRRIPIRSIGENFKIFDANNRMIGDIDGIRVYKECHQGAIYLHGGSIYRVTGLDLDNFKVIVENGPEEIFTQALSEKETEILSTDGEFEIPNARVYRGRLRVRERVAAYRIRRIFTGELISTHELDLPELIFETRGIWLSFQPEMIETARESGLHPMGGLHALEHAVIGLFPLVSICDCSDLAGISTCAHPQTGGPAVFIYDAFPGGLGLAESALEHLHDLLVTTRENVRNCSCESGCPLCIQSPKCGSGNEPLDKRACIRFLTVITDPDALEPDEVTPETVPKPVEVIMNGMDPPESDRDQFTIPDLPAENDCPAGSVIVFDLETQLSADEVGGWHNADKMRMAIGVIYDVRLDRFEFYREPDAGRLIKRLSNARVVIGFNILRFDYKVLAGYDPGFTAPPHSLDILVEIQNRLGHRLSLNQLADATLDIHKSADGLQSLAWWKQGYLDKIARYCRQDVEITCRIYMFGVQNGYILYHHRRGIKVKIPVEWELNRS